MALAAVYDLGRGHKGPEAEGPISPLSLSGKGPRVVVQECKKVRALAADFSLMRARAPFCRARIPGDFKLFLQAARGKFGSCFSFVSFFFLFICGWVRPGLFGASLISFRGRARWKDRARAGGWFYCRDFPLFSVCVYNFEVGGWLNCGGFGKLVGKVGWGVGAARRWTNRSVHVASLCAWLNGGLWHSLEIGGRVEKSRNVLIYKSEFFYSLICWKNLRFYWNNRYEHLTLIIHSSALLYEQRELPK